MGLLNRDEHLARLDGEFDVLVIGGGATGLGIAVDAATRGYRTVLVEARDFASGTSSRSTKLIHGGVRYLAQGRVGLVREALQERALLRRNAPHLVKELPIILPSYAWHSLPMYAAGLKLYDALAGRTGFQPSRLLSRGEVLERLPGINPEGLQGGVLYHDGQFDDARLAIALAQTAAEHGAVVCNYLEVNRFVYSEGRICGVAGTDGESGATVTIKARVVINATGMASDSIRRLDRAKATSGVTFSQGSHIVLPLKLLGEGDALLVPRTEDHRVIFATPWLGHLLVGTTDIEVHDPEADPTPTRAEVQYLLEHINRYLVIAASERDISAAFAGIRPLVTQRSATTAALSREHHVEISASGLVSITGGKWTTYRKMAEDTLNAAIAAGQLQRRRCLTRELALHGAGDDAPRAGDVLETYGTDAKEVRALMKADPSLAAPIHSALAYSWAEVVYAARHEMARTVEDVLARRTRALFLNANASLQAATGAAEILARELGRSPEWETKQVEALQEREERTMKVCRNLVIS
jgi:glycerol-3-phosphate dehydrogenase